ncbi:MAG: beta-hydroxyacyl-ACP dehydratase [Rubripirellula sp.]|jgi:3-hydroxyacyl-[acyl-carrier-protein] dehydratase|nr:beta-hydroxyacyl-ACP dehydratase [Rubripirellula sp.]
MSSDPPQMKYRQIDRITSIEPGKRLTAERTLRADEEYLKDHFPRFPVMPGVMMLEALHQAAVWLVRAGDDFQTPLVLLRETRSVKFGDFLAPGETLQITVKTVKEDGNRITLKASATKQGRITVSARLILERCTTGDPAHFGTDAKVLRSTKEQFQVLTEQLTEQVTLGD